MTLHPSSIVVQSEPAVEPVTVDEAKAHLRIDHDDDDAVLAGLIVAARHHVESLTGRALITQTLDVGYAGLDEILPVPRCPLQSVTSVTYLDLDGVSRTVAGSVYRVHTAREPGAIELDYGQSWPSLYPVAEPVTVRVVAGYGDTSDSIPQPIRQALLLLVGHWFEAREAAGSDRLAPIPMGVDAILAPYIVYRF